MTYECGKTRDLMEVRDVRTVPEDVRGYQSLEKAGLDSVVR